MHYSALLLIVQWILAAPIPTRLGSPPAPSYSFRPHRLVVDAASRPLKPLLSPEQGPAQFPATRWLQSGIRTTLKQVTPATPPGPE